MRRSHRAVGAIGVGVAMVVFATGCSLLRSGDGGEAVSAADLQKDIADRLARAGQAPKSLACQGGLAAETGASTRCDVVLSDTNSIQPIVTLTSVNPLNYDVTAAVSREQLATAVAGLLSGSDVTCQSGLDGKTGAQAQCTVTKDGVRAVRTVEVTNVEGLLMSYEVLPVLSRDQVQGLLGDRLAQSGPRPERVECLGDLQGKVGATLDCTAVVGGSSEQFMLTVTNVNGDVIDFGVTPKG